MALETIEQQFERRKKILIEMGFKYIPKTALKDAHFSYYGKFEFVSALTARQAESSFKMDIQRYKNKLVEYAPLVQHIKDGIINKLQNPDKIKREDLIKFISEF